MSKKELYELLAQEIMEETLSHRCKCLDGYKLASLLELVIDNPEIIQCIIKKDKNNIFEEVYNNHIVNGYKEFILMTPINSIAHTWIFRLYK
jgi:hypothetical protein